MNLANVARERSLLLFATAAVVLLAAASSGHALEPPRVDARLDAALASATGPVHAIVVFRSAPAEAHVGRIAATLKAEELRPRRIYRTFPAAAVELTRSALAQLRLDPTVSAVILDSTVRALLVEGTALIRSDQANALGYRGQGQVVAVIDTGIDGNHSELGSASIPNDKVIGGWDFANDDSNPRDDNDHGTAVAGIIASSRGVAPDAKLVALKALDEDGEGEDSDILAAIDWCVEHQEELAITVINMSFGGDAHSGTCDDERRDYRDAMAAANAAGILVVAASGNEAEDERISEPACISSVIAVGAVYDEDDLDAHDYCELWDPLGIICLDRTCEDSHPDADEICCYSNSSSELDLLAPANDCTTTERGGGWLEDFGGTSAAAPYAAGVIALVLEAGGERGTEAMRALLRSTGQMIRDDRNGLSFPRINAEAAVEAAEPTCELPPAPDQPTVPTLPVAAGETYQVSWNAIEDVVEYEIEEYVGEVGGSPLSVLRTSATSASYTHGGESATYLYRVRAFRICGEGPWSPVAQVTVEAGGGPGGWSFDYVVAGAGWLEGAGGTRWETHLSAFNPSSQPTTAVVYFLLTDHDNSSGVVTSELVLAPFSVSQLPLDPVEGGWTGALAVGADQPIVVEARVENDADGGTYGQGFPGQPEAEGLRSGQVADLVGLRSNVDYRTNLGLVNLSLTPATVEVRLFHDATELDAYQVQLLPFGHHQDFDVFSTYGDFTDARGRAEIRPLSGGEPIFAYASVVDWRSGDPTTVLMRVRAE